MKALRLYRGHDSYGRQIEAAEAVNGVWYCREWGYNGYAPAWSRWAIMTIKPINPTKIRNHVEFSGAPEYVDVENPQDFLEWGFNNLRLTSAPYRVRLPD